jgi:hypothetical protein
MGAGCSFFVVFLGFGAMLWIEIDGWSALFTLGRVFLGFFLCALIFRRLDGIVLQ